LGLFQKPSNSEDFSIFCLLDNDLCTINMELSTEYTNNTHKAFLIVYCQVKTAKEIILLFQNFEDSIHCVNL